jgi:hypothetical protein
LLHPLKEWSLRESRSGSVALAGCATGPDIRADYDKSADFGKYRTYGFVAQAGTDTWPAGGATWRPAATGRARYSPGTTA